MLDSLIYVVGPQSVGGATLSVGARAEVYLELCYPEADWQQSDCAGKKWGVVVEAVDTNSDHPEATPKSS